MSSDIERAVAFTKRLWECGSSTQRTDSCPRLKELRWRRQRRSAFSWSPTARRPRTDCWTRSPAGDKTGPCEFALLIPDVERPQAGGLDARQRPAAASARCWRPGGGHPRRRRSLHVRVRRGARRALRRDHRLDAAQEDVQVAATRPRPKDRGPRAARSLPSRHAPPGTNYRHECVRQRDDLVAVTAMRRCGR